MTKAHRMIPTPLDGDAVEFGALTLPMTPPSLNNIFINVKKGRIKAPEYVAWQIRASMHIRKQSGWHVPGKVRVRLAFNERQTRCDLDNLIKACLDILMANGRISDDRNVRKLEAEFCSTIVGTLIEIRRLDVAETQPSAPYSAKRARQELAKSFPSEAA